MFGFTVFNPTYELDDKENKWSKLNFRRYVGTTGIS
jgi:hypothetical protein